MPRSEAPIISKISAPDQDINLNKQPKIATERPKFFSLSIIMFFLKSSTTTSTTTKLLLRLSSFFHLIFHHFDLIIQHIMLI